MPQGTRRCDTCDYYQAVEETAEHGYGGCRRYPPQYVLYPRGLTMEEQTRARWPSVKPDVDWCGEWRQAVATTLPAERGS